MLGSTVSKINKDKNDENVPHLEVIELVLVHCNLVNNDYQQDSRILNPFVLNKKFGSLLKISPTNHVLIIMYVLILNFKKSEYGSQIKQVNQ